MTEPNYKERNANADSKLDEAKRHLEKAIEDDAHTHDTRASVIEALRHVIEAQSYLRE